MCCRSFKGLFSVVCSLFWIAAASAHPLIELETVAVPGGVAIDRFELEGGDIIQVQSGCGEWASGGMAIWVRLSEAGAGDSPEVTLFDAGPMYVQDDYLVVQSQRQVGSDGSDEPLSLPEGCKAPFTDMTGTTLCSRVLIASIETGDIIEFGWDTFAPVLLEGSQLLLMVRARPGHTHSAWEEREFSELILVDLISGSAIEVSDIEGLPRYREEAGVITLPATSRKGEYLEVDMSTGDIRALAATDVSLDTPLFEPPLHSPLLAEDPALSAATQTEMRVLNRGAWERPEFGWCGVPGFHHAGDLIFVDQGVFRVPEMVE